MPSSHDVIEMTKYIFISKYIFSITIVFDTKHAKPNIGRIFKMNITLIVTYLHLNRFIVKSFTFFKIRDYF